MNRFALILLLIITASLSAQELPGVEEVLEKFKAAGESLTSFTADFAQIEIDEFGDTHRKSGSIYFLAPGRYKLITFLDGKPLEELGKNVEEAWRTRHHVKTIDHVPVGKEAEVNEGYSFADADDLRNSFDLEVKGIEELETGPAWHLVGNPKEDKGIELFEVWINIENPSPLVKLKASKKYSSETMTFTNIQRNVAVDSDLFIYEELDGYTVYER